MDLGTGYYLAMVHDIQGKYEVMRYGFKVKPDGSMAKQGNSPVKFWSDVYFDPSFDLRSVPRLIATGNIANVISNTSVSEASKDGWVQV